MTEVLVVRQLFKMSDYTVPQNKSYTLLRHILLSKTKPDIPKYYGVLNILNKKKTVKLHDVRQWLLHLHQSYNGEATPLSQTQLEGIARGALPRQLTLSESQVYNNIYAAKL